MIARISEPIYIDFVDTGGARHGCMVPAQHELPDTERKGAIHMQIQRAEAKTLVESKLPDGSRVLLDPRSEKVFALNAMAGAAWDACSSPISLSQMAEAMQRTLDCAVGEELAEEAVLQLRAQNLVIVSGSNPATSRRSFMTKMAASAALPLVAAMTMTEQRAYAQYARSDGQRQPPPPPPPPHNNPWPPKNHFF